MAKIAAIWRHPIKSHGRESLASVLLSAGQALPWDRRWAVVHDNAHVDMENPVWVPCQNFMIGTRIPALAGIWAALDEETGKVTLRHVDLGALTFDPDTETPAFLDWVAPLCAVDRAMPTGIINLGTRGATDTDYPSVTVMNMASHRAVETAMGQPLETERWRGNFWVEGLPAWQERAWIGHHVRIGSAVLLVREDVRRCQHTAANPVTGQRDADTLGTLEQNFGHRNFGVNAEIVESGLVNLDDKVELL